MQANAEGSAVKWRKLLVSMGIGAVAGAAGASAVLALGGGDLLGALTVSQDAALLVALVYLLMGLAVGFGVVSPRLGAKFLNVADAEELIEERTMLVLSALGCILFAAGLAALALGGGEGGLSPAAALAIFAVSLAVGVWLSLRMLRHADELMRQIMHEAAGASFYAVFAVLGGWAALAHLDFVTAPAMLDVITMLYGLSLAACFWVIGRRGMLVR